MLQIVPTHWYSWNFTVTDESRPVADIATTGWRKTGVLTIDDARYEVSRETPISGDFVLQHDGNVLARAGKPSIFRRDFVIQHDGHEYRLAPKSLFGRTHVLLDESREIGSVAPENAFTRHAAADLPHDLPLPVRMFVVWLTLLSWRRHQNSG